jgi:ornithine cyclodeaminase
MIILTASDVRQALPMAEAIKAVKRGFAMLAEGLAQVPQRHHLSVDTHDGVGLVMSALVNDPQGEAMVVKEVSVFPRNVDQGLPTITAAVLVVDPCTGREQALLEGATLTAIRTGAASGAATDLLARSDSRVVAILGAGAQGRTQLEGVCSVRSVETVWVYDVVPSKTEAYTKEMGGRGQIPADVRAALSAREAVADADIICCATTSETPVFVDGDLKSGVHINAVGSYRPAMQEVPAETVARALVVVDSREAALSEAGDLIKPIHSGMVGADHIHAELGELVLGQRPGREDSGQITLFKTVGVAVEDAVTARLAVLNAKIQGLGQLVQW